MEQILLKYLKTQMLISNLSSSIYGNEFEDTDKNIFTSINHKNKETKRSLSIREIPNEYDLIMMEKIFHNCEVILLTAKYLSY